MKARVLEAFGGFSTRFEGRLPFMYTDAVGLVTTGVGNLIDGGPRASAGDTVAPQPWVYAPALVLPWKRSDGSAASRDDIIAEWREVKGAWPHVQSAACRNITTLHLEDAFIDYLVAEKARANEVDLRTIFANFDALPADAQLAIHSMAWAMGAEGVRTFKHLVAAVDAGDFLTAAAQSHMQGVGIDARNAANIVLFSNAAAVASAGGDPEALWYPASVTAADIPAGGDWRPFAIVAGAVALASAAAWALFGREQS